MKRLTIVLAVIVAAVVANAAQFAWQTSGKFVDATDKSTVLTSYATDTSIVLVYLGNSSLDGWTLDWSSAVETTSVGSIKGGTAKGKVGATLPFVYGADGAYVNGDTFGIMFKDSTGALSLLYSATDDSAITTTYTISGLANNAWTGTQFNPTSGNFYAIPEPTSGFLLLIGVVGLALKRKQA